MTEAPRPEDSPRALAALALLAGLGGTVTGAIVSLFLMGLHHASALRDALLTWFVVHLNGPAAYAGPALMAAFSATCAALAAWLVLRFARTAAGSGIPHVEAVVDGRLPPAGLRLVPVKFFGGILAIGGGLALGREGPCVQMGAGIAHLTTLVFRRAAVERSLLTAACAGAGLAAAFNAPIAGAIFVLEELVRRFENRLAIAALMASSASILVSRLMLGNVPALNITVDLPDQPLISGIYLAFGMVLGLIAVAYNQTILATQDIAARLPLPPVARAALIGAAIGALAWFLPAVVGGGDHLSQAAIDGEVGLAALPALIAIRFLLGAVSFSAGTPGGLLAPMLALGALIGLWLGHGLSVLLPGLDITPEGFAVVGMAAFFAGSVRAPLTAIVIVTEMTANVAMLLPMLAACAGALILPTVLRNPPIYNALGARLAGAPLRKRD